MGKRKGIGYGARQPVEYSKLWSYPRHPNFDAMWAKYERLVWWWAHRMAWIANRAEGRFSRRRHCRFYWEHTAGSLKRVSDVDYEAFTASSTPAAKTRKRKSGARAK